ncbi:hypothetical protein AB0P21_07540 [Kribbella sp. NPDC056861]|uniref:hypothetical protein n=1 Tax=Kribbella sp. NPDC056861 TaxID=3154857 RepID=UPI0034239583
MNDSVPEQWTVRVRLAPQACGFALSALVIALAGRLGFTGVRLSRGEGGEPLYVFLLFGVGPLLLLALGAFGLVTTARSIIRPALAVDSRQIRLGSTTVAWDEVRGIVIGPVYDWDLATDEFVSDRYREPQEIRLVLRDGSTKEWKTPDSETPWDATALRDGFRRFSLSIPVTITGPTEYRDGPKEVEG